MKSLIASDDSVSHMRLVLMYPRISDHLIRLIVMGQGRDTFSRCHMVHSIQMKMHGRRRYEKKKCENQLSVVSRRKKSSHSQIGRVESSPMYHLLEKMSLLRMTG